MTKNKWFKPFLFMIFIALGLAALYYSFNLANFFALETNLVGNESGGFDSSIETEATLAPEAISTKIAEASAGAEEDGGFDYSVFGTWEGSERINILIMGLDLRDWEAGEGAPRTDSMLVLTIDPLSKTAGMLSIPRDLWVSIPGFSYDRINTAYRNGVTYDYPGGGPALAAKTVESFLGVPIHYYAQIDFNVFVRMVDEIGGVKIHIREPILVDVIGDKPPKHLERGRQVLSGEVALAYARARNTEGGDFDRAERQQDVILGLRETILQWDRLPLLLSKAPVLYGELNEGIQTNMSLDEAIKLAILALEIPLDDIERGIISAQDAVPYTTATGDKVLKPLPDKIRLVRDQVFGSTPDGSPLASLDLMERIAAEDANILVLNGTQIFELSNQTIDYLNGLGGFSIPAENAGAANQAYLYTQVIDLTGNPYTMEFLIDHFNVQENMIELQFTPGGDIDIILNLGSVWANENPMP
jgi:LCP family protein required for cell wall assembly